MINKLLKALKFEKSNLIKLTVSHKNAKKIKIVRPLKFSKAGSKLVKEQKSKKSNSIKKKYCFQTGMQNHSIRPKKMPKVGR
jgi:phosphorylcholine metabolism protein LicD